MLTNLEELIIEASKAYYSGNPIMSDEEFDSLVEKLKKENPKSEILHSTGWGYEPEDERTFKHKFFVSSLEKIRYDDLVKTFSDYALRMFIVTPKLDGVSAVAYYREGKLERVLSRGNGWKGIDITNNIKHDIPISGNFEFQEFSVRGEIIITKSDFDKMNSKLQVKYKNSRNAAAGISQSKTGENSEYLKFIAYTVVLPISENQKLTKPSMLAFLENFTFRVVPDFSLMGNDIPQILSRKMEHVSRYEWFKKLTSKGEYPIDGLVITLSSDPTAFEMAYKFDSDVKTSVVKDITWTLNPTGKLTPKIEIEPVDLSGASVTFVTGNSINFMKKNNISIGSLVSVTRSNEVIPKIVNVIEPGNGEVNIPELCPVCKSKLEVSGAHLYCVNGNCPQKYEAMIDTFWEHFRVKSAGDAAKDFMLEMWEFERPMSKEEVKRFFANLEHNIKETIEEISNRPYIPHKHLMVLKTLQNVTKKVSTYTLLKLTSYPQYGDSAIMNDIQKYKTFSNLYKDIVPAIKTRLDILLQFFEPIDSEVSTSKGVVAITGKLSVPRSEFQKKLIEAGWSVSGSISSKTKFLITNQVSSSSKFRRAKGLGIQIVTEDEFVKQYM